MGLHASNMVVRLKQSDRACEKNKHDLAKQLKKAGTSGQESTVFITISVHVLVAGKVQHDL